VVEPEYVEADPGTMAKIFELLTEQVRSKEQRLAAFFVTRPCPAKRCNG
jgi:hypothetical protein